MFNFGVSFVVVTSVVFWVVFFVAAVNVCCRAAGKDDASWGKLMEAAASEQSFLYAKIVFFGLFVRLLSLAFSYLILYLNGNEPSLLSVFEAFNRWDAPHYLVLADIGYGYTENGRNILLVFFPLFPYLVRLVNFVTGDFLTAAFFVSFASYCAGLVFLYRLVRLDFSAKVAWYAVLLISVFPHSFFFGAPYTESIFLLTTVMTLYFIRTHKWLLAGITGAFASFSRMVGVILIIVTAVEFITHYKIFTLKLREVSRLIFSKGIWILLMLSGTAAYLLINWFISGDPFRFLYYQEAHWHNVSQYFGITILNNFQQISERGITYPLVTFTIIPNILAFTFAILMLIYAIIKKINLTLIVYSLGYVVLSFSLSWLLSGARYVAACATLFIFLAVFVEKTPSRRIIVPLVFLTGLGFFMGTFITGEWVF